MKYRTPELTIYPATALADLTGPVTTQYITDLDVPSRVPAEESSPHAISKNDHASSLVDVSSVEEPAAGLDPPGAQLAVSGRDARGCRPKAAV